MAAKPMILKEFEKLPPSAQREVERLVRQLKKTCAISNVGLRRKTDAKRQAASIKKWAGKIVGSGFSGRDHDKILYGDKG